MQSLTDSLSDGQFPVGLPTPSSGFLSDIYRRRFEFDEAYRDAVWKVIVAELVQPCVDRSSAVLDLGTGYAEFINNVRCSKRYAMDLNPDSAAHVAADVTVFHQDCAAPWPLPDASLDVVFSSNFFEHLPTKDALRATLAEARRCLRPGGRLICTGPNLRYVGGAYWDFIDHHLPLTDRSLRELLELMDYSIERCVPRLLPYSMSGTRQYPTQLVRWYLRLPPAWRFLGSQFFIVALRP